MSVHTLRDLVLFQDSLVLVLNKPAGIPVHAGPNGGESLEDGFDQLHFGYKERPRLAHRLDRDTSGCLILGRNDRALRKLGRLFEQGLIQKTYWAITDTAPSVSSGTIDVPLKKIKKPKGWTMVPTTPDDPDGQEAITHYRLLETAMPNTFLWELEPRTGRTHQLRVHLQAIGCPIRNDWLYGPATARPASGEFPQLYLHARSVVIPLYDNAPPLQVTAPAPAAFAGLINKNS